ncbi:MAG: ATP synthase F1 subunit delta [Cytophagales bacterium]|nr:MAG: ATP synthase F1 subunit delta [Cytophagales bacterium]
MNQSRVAYPYAKSLFQLSLELRKVEEVLKDMQLISLICLENPSFQRILESPIIPQDKKRNILDILLKGRVTDITLQICDLLRKKNRIIYLFDIANQYINIYKKENNILSAELISAVPVSDTLKEEFKSLILKKFNSSNIDLTQTLNKEILGGYILKVGDRQIDQSIKGKLVSLKNKFKDNPYISKL